MFVVQLRFSENRALASQYMEAHNAWLRKGFEEGVLLLSGTLQPKLGGAILADGKSRKALEKRLAEDPFVAKDVVSAEILEITPGQADKRLQFLVA